MLLEKQGLSDRTFNFNIENLVNAIYFVELMQEEHFKVFKLVKSGR
ncbi:MAG: hypothetical protein WD048_14150 [Chitinophagales bacterium]